MDLKAFCLLCCWNSALYSLQHCAVAAVHPKRKQVTELLLRKGANVNEKNKEYVSEIFTFSKDSVIGV